MNNSNILRVELSSDSRLLDIINLVNRNKHCHILLTQKEIILPQDFLEKAMEIFEKDPLIAFVNPRYLPDCNNNNEAAINTKAWQKYPLYFEYIPIAKSFCVLIKSQVLIDFEFIFRHEEYLEFAAFCNNYGFRSTILNHTLAYSEKLLPPVQINNFAKYPAIKWGLKEYDTCAENKFAKLYQSVILQKKISILIDLTDVPTHSNGTNHVACELIKAINTDINRYKDQITFFIYLNKNQDSILQKIDFNINNAVILREITNQRFLFALKLGQIWNFSKFCELSHCALYNFYYFYDTIATDCFPLRKTGNNLDSLWSFTSQYADGIFFISEFSKAQFNLRYKSKCLTKAILIPNTTTPTITKASSVVDSILKLHNYILILGNSLPHKALLETATLVSKLKNIPKIVLIGTKQKISTKQMVSFTEGILSNNDLFALYKHAGIVIYPSYYEGFGLPMVEAISLNKTVFARNLPVYSEIQNKYNISAEQLILFDNNEDLAFKLKLALITPESDLLSADVNNSSWLLNLDEIIKELIAYADNHDHLTNSFSRNKSLFFQEKFWLEAQGTTSFSLLKLTYRKLILLLKKIKKNWIGL